MKVVFTRLLFILITLNLSVAVAQQDTNRVMASMARIDSPKMAESPAFNKPTPQLPVFVKYTENVNLANLNRTADSIRMEDSVAEFSHLRMLAGIRSTDSANVRMLARQIDTIKSPQYIHALDSMKQRFTTLPTDSLKLLLKPSENKLYKGPIYTAIASRYFDYDTLSNKQVRSNHQTQALNYTMQALHQYSLYNDTSGMRITFDALAKIYVAQRKYSQAKWFILQSNTLSRVKNDVPNTIASLVALASVKSEIKDYDLAMRDLNEALQLSQTNHMQKTEAEVLRNFGMLYSRLKNYDKEAVVLKKRDSIEASIQKAQDAAALAKLKTQDSIKTKQVAALALKKKADTSGMKKSFKSNSAKRIASL
jgi:tetratricopeptide (TPR) repeat protein